MLALVVLWTDPRCGGRPDAPGGGLTAEQVALVNLAREGVRGADDPGVAVAVLGSAAEAAADMCARLPIDELFVGPQAGSASGDETGVIEWLVDRLGPALILATHRPRPREVLAYVSGRRGLPFVPMVDALERRDDGRWRVTRKVAGGHFRAAESRGPEAAIVMTIDPHHAGSEAGNAPSESPVEPRPAPQMAGSAAASGPGNAFGMSTSPEATELACAPVVFGVGRGIGDAETMRELHAVAEAVGGAIAATRGAVESGWCGRDRLVGLTGVQISPRVYFGIGISGAPQHVVGFSTATTVFAVNNDPRCGMFRYADYGVTTTASDFVARLRALVSSGLVG